MPLLAAGLAASSARLSLPTLLSGALSMPGKGVPRCGSAVCVLSGCGEATVTEHGAAPWPPSVGVRVVGFVTAGHLSPSQGRGLGLALCSAAQLQRVLAHLVAHVVKEEKEKEKEGAVGGEEAALCRVLAEGLPVLIAPLSAAPVFGSGPGAFPAASVLKSSLRQALFHLSCIDD
jgi:hypothetical protein